MTEGSVEIDEGGFPTSAPKQEETPTGDSGNTNPTDDVVEDQDTGGEEDGGEDDVEYTEKGTKKDPDPKSAVHQELANAKRYINQMEQVLGSPEMLRKYAKQNNISLAEAKKELEDEQEEQEDVIEEITADDLKDANSVAKILNNIKSSSAQQVKALREENQKLRENLEGVSGKQRNATVLQTMQSEISTVQSKYPELNPKSSDYDKELEAEIGSLYEELDFDPTSKSFRGKVSLLKLTDRIMKAAGKAKKQASKEAQTDVHVKKRGKVVTGKGKSKKSTSSDSAGTTIAQRIAKATGNG